MQLRQITVAAVLEGTTTQSYSAPDSFGATRTDTPLIDTPQSVQIMTRQALEDIGASDVGDAYDYMAGIVPDDSGGGVRGDDYISRGFEGDNLLINGNRSGSLSKLDTANVEQIEVLRGPTSVLFGRADPGGLVNVVTKQPLFEPLLETSVKAKGGLTGQGKRLRSGRVGLDAGGPLNGDATIRYRLNSAVEVNRSFRKHVDESLFIIAPVIEADIGSKTIVNAEVTYQHREDALDRGVPFVNGRLQLDRNFNPAGAETPHLQKHYANSAFRIEHELDKTWRARLGLSYNYNGLDGDGIVIRIRPNNPTATLLRRDNRSHSRYAVIQPELVGEFSTGSINHTALIGTDIAYTETNSKVLNGRQSKPFNILSGRLPNVPEARFQDMTRDRRVRNIDIDTKSREYGFLSARSDRF